MRCKPSRPLPPAAGGFPGMGWWPAPVPTSSSWRPPAGLRRFAVSSRPSASGSPVARLRAASSGRRWSGSLDRTHELRERFLGVAEEHGRLRVVEQVVVDPGKAGTHAALEEDHVVRLVDVEYGHAVNGAAG